MQLIAAGILFLSGLLLELCWLGVWTTFVWDGFMDRPFPLPDMLVCASCAALLAGLRMRNGLSLALHAAGMVSFWLGDSQRVGAGGNEELALLGLSTAAFWISGVLHARRTLSYRVVCARFDFGMCWLLALLGLRLLWRSQAQVPQHAALTDALVPCFFVNALCAICVARFRGQASKQWLRVSGRIAMFFGALATLGAVGFSIAWICRPYLRALASSGHAGAAVIVRPIANAAAELLFWVMREGKKHPVPVYLPGRLPRPYPGRRSMPDAIEAMAMDQSALTALGIAVGVLALCGAAFWLWWNRHWLSASQGGPGETQLWKTCLQLWRRALAWLRAFGKHTEAEPLRMMNALLIWGERSGVARQGAETPLEYAHKLKRSFAAMSGAIDQIIENHCQQTYALRDCNEHELRKARQALKLLRSPRQWWARTANRWRALHARSSATSRLA